MNKDTKMKIVFTGGGTAGHVSPNIAIIEELEKISKKKDIDLDVIYIGRREGIEKNIVLENKIKYKRIFSGKFRRYWDFRNLTDPFLVFLGFIQSLLLLLLYKPDVVFAKGGFVTIPVGLAAFLLKIPLIIHESDSVLGLSNKILLRFASKIALGFPLEVYDTGGSTSLGRSNLHKKGFFSGNPVRNEIKEFQLDKIQLYLKYNFDRRRKMILILGGSQGAQRMNEFIDSILEELLKKYVVVHSVGEKGAQHFKEKRAGMAEGVKKNYLAYSFIKEEIGDFLNNADLVISRAGAGAISEIIYTKRPSILIPFSYAVSDHQNKNARFLQSKGIASVLEERYLTSYKLLKEIEYLMENKKETEEMVENMSKIFKLNSAKLIVEEILKYKK